MDYESGISHRPTAINQTRSEQCVAMAERQIEAATQFDLLVSIGMNFLPPRLKLY
jgi:hypothetical protein